jgi:hypothetical protein
MNETPEADQDSAPQASAFQNVANAESFTILVHGVGAGTSKELLDEAKKGILHSGFVSSETEIWLSDCPSLSGKKGAEAILIHGTKGGHFVIALPWSKRVRLGVLARRCAIALIMITVITVMGYVINGPVEWLRSSWHRFLLYPLAGVVASIVNVFIPDGKKQYRLSAVSMAFLLLISTLLQLTFTWWAPWLWLPVAFLIATLWVMAGYTIIRCIPIARTLGWKIILVMLVAAPALFGAAMVRTTSYYSRQTKAYLGRYIGASVLEDNLSKSLPPDSSQHTAVLPDAAAGKESVEPRQSHTAKISYLMAEIDGDLATCLSLTAICIMASWVVFWFDWALDLGLDVLHYESDRKGRNSLLIGLADAIRWLHRQAPNAHLTVVGHSLGSVIAAHAVSSISTSDPIPGQIALITSGSLLNYLYRVFPTIVKSPHELAKNICPRAQWSNLWRKHDEVGRELDMEPGILVQYCIGNGHHNNYWEDGAVWNAVAYESLKIGDFRGTPITPGNPARGLLEAYLGFKAVGAIGAIFVLTLFLLYLPIWLK